MSRLFLDRRTFLAGAGASLLMTPASGLDLSDDAALFASAYGDRSRGYGIAILDEEGEILSRHPLPARGHGMANHIGAGRLIIFARRPGNFALSITMDGSQRPTLFSCPPDRHFYGHGVVSGDGAILYATENNYDSGLGVIGIYEIAADVKRIGEFSSHGIGPHDIKLMSDQRTLCVANGGIKTHPAYGRAKLNLDSMQSNIVLIDLQSGHLIESHVVPDAWSRLSLRHMAEGGGKIWLGGQNEGDLMDQTPLIACLRPGHGLAFPDRINEAARQLRGYVGSVEASADGQRIGVTSPKGNQMIVLNAGDGSVLKTSAVRGVCGIADLNNQFIVSSQHGEFAASNHALSWDNHIVKVGA